MPDVPTPETPVEEYLSIFAGGSGNPPPPSSRVEEYLTLILDNHSGTIPTKVSDLTNDLGFQTESEVIAAIRSELAGIVQIEYQVVNSLPQFGELGVIYLVPNGGSGNNVKDEYLWLATTSSFEKIGTTEVDLTGYATTAAMNTALAGKVNTENGKGLSSNDYTNADKAKVASALTEHQDISGKVDKVAGKGLSTNDYTDVEKTKLDGIESGAQVNPSAATTSTAGLMSAADKVKLDGISPNASGLSAVSLPTTIAGDPIASFTSDAAGRTLNPLLVQIDPVQADGTLVDGEIQPPSPTNVRAITGWTGVKLMRTGKNLLCISNGTVGPTNGVTATISGGVITINGTSSAGSNGMVIAEGIALPAGVYMFTGCPAGGGYPRWTLQLLGNYVGETGRVEINDEGSGRSFTVPNGKTLVCKLRAFSYSSHGEYNNFRFYPMVRLASVSDSTFEASGAMLSISFPSSAGTVYGGTLDAAKGILTVTKTAMNIPSVNSFSGDNSKPYIRLEPAGMLSTYSADTTILSDVFRSSYPLDGASFMCYRTSQYAVLGLPSGYTVSEFNSNVAGHTLVYSLATPVTYTLTPAQVTTLLGTNNVWADCGAVTVTYPSGTGTPVLTLENLDAAGGTVSWETFQEKIQELTNAIEAMGGNTP